MNAEDIYNALHYAFGVQDPMVCVAEVDTSATTLIGSKVPSFISYHSISFTCKSMRLWCYFGVGEGKFQPFLGVQFQPGIKIIKDFSATDKAVAKSKQKQIVRESRILNILLFCQEEGCTTVFTSKIEYEQHNLEGRHIYSAPEKGGMDRVKKSYASRMKLSSQLHALLYFSSNESEYDLDSACQISSAMSIFKETGWALSVRSNFRYTCKHKKVLYNIFIEGEIKGKKMSPEQVEKILRQKLQVSEYVTSKQITSLFSKWHSIHRQGKLKEPTDDQTQKNVDNPYDNKDSDDDKDYAIDLDTKEGISQRVLLQ